jgi:hypothetical protein
MNWISYILAVLVAVLTLIQFRWDYLLKNFFKDGRTNDHKSLRKKLFIVALILIILNTVVSIINSYNKDVQAKADKRELTNQLATITAENLKLREEVSQGFRDISHEFSTNEAIASAIRLAVLNDALEKNSEQRKELQKSHELSVTEAVDMKTLRAERENELALQENQKRQEAIQQEIDNIQKNKYAKEAAKAAELAAKNQQWANEELVRTEKVFADQILPIFDYAIRELDRMLAKISGETGQSRHSDFLGEMPTIYASALVKTGMIVNGTNTLGIGTNSAWNFKISTSISPVRATPDFSRPPNFNMLPDRITVFFGPNYTSISIMGGATNNESTLTIEPYIPWNSDIGFYEIRPDAGTSFYQQLSIKLKVPNGLNIDELQPSTNYNDEIDKALHRLIEAQDQQSPLILKTEK